MNMSSDVTLRLKRLRDHSLSEQIADALIHGLGILLAVFGILLLLHRATQAQQSHIIGLLVYAGGMVAMFGASAAYNIFYASRFREVLRKADHAAIFLMIAGTYTPFILFTYSQPWAILLSLSVWAFCLSGIGLKFINPPLFEKLSLALYLALGWCALVLLGPGLWSHAPQLLLPVALGGALYTFGVTFHIWETLPYQNAIWHAFVLAAAACHYYAVWQGVTQLPALA
ncbi:MAG: hemolysin III family protein [Hyphomicrobiales bacterium]|nr:hemolysin III family protein [Hyphomicrobiales bacterium]MDE2114751.1 hemolysin III family protein [Hyphomicrobiales bacterium]